MADKIVAEFKQKEFDRLKDLVLNQMSEIEVGLNPQSVGRHAYGSHDMVIIPTRMEIAKLNTSLIELRENLLTPNEEELIK